jgi:hypothetical protein
MLEAMISFSDDNLLPCGSDGVFIGVEDIAAGAGGVLYLYIKKIHNGMSRLKIITYSIKQGELLYFCWEEAPADSCSIRLTQ